MLQQIPTATRYPTGLSDIAEQAATVLIVAETPASSSATRSSSSRRRRPLPDAHPRAARRALRSFPRASRRAAQPSTGPTRARGAFPRPARSADGRPRGRTCIRERDARKCDLGECRKRVRVVILAYPACTRRAARIRRLPIRNRARRIALRSPVHAGHRIDRSVPREQRTVMPSSTCRPASYRPGDGMRSVSAR
ncbi:hypothetical protein K523DRAFT_325522 [Schizophyllum commune Tattone D]|nr:hypothetical protein K523DRAFT_325522 [Schizophyllum commune Tattone D]